MADQRKITLYQGHATPATIILRALPVADVSTGTTIRLRTLHATPRTIILGGLPGNAVSGDFPTQYAGLRYFLGTVKELALVALADAPAGDQWRIRKGGTDYAVYLVDTTDPNASQIRIQTSEGVKAARLKT